MSNSKFRRHVVSRGAQCPEDDMERNVGESKLFKGVQVICSITALKLKVCLFCCNTLSYFGLLFLN